MLSVLFFSFSLSLPGSRFWGDAVCVIAWEVLYSTGCTVLSRGFQGWGHTHTLAKNKVGKLHFAYGTLGSSKDVKTHPMASLFASLSPFLYIFSPPSLSSLPFPVPLLTVSPPPPFLFPPPLPSSSLFPFLSPLLFPPYPVCPILYTYGFMSSCL